MSPQVFNFPNQLTSLRLVLAVVLFGFIVEHAGLFVSTVVLIVGASAASHEFRWKEALASGVFFALLAIAVFVLGLKLQLPIWPPALYGPH